MKSMTLLLATLACLATMLQARPFTPELLLGGLVISNAALIGCVVSNCNGGGRGFNGFSGGFRGPPRGFRGGRGGFRGGFRGPGRFRRF
ncbi:WW domain-containing protein C660.06-like [Hyalella azteca]|uniref:WW domain-containing protein C660.06-like n=1 Tax=Hyalella azteca TaxID=294128 RepID=A0A8B7NTA6_HYAAZ|nr:WW domain-containing protein C660.06-like [Hyalella azteca]